MKKFLKNGGLVLAGSVAAVSSAFAAVPAAVTTSLTGAQTDSVEVAGTVLAIIVAIAAFRYMRKAI